MRLLGAVGGKNKMEMREAQSTSWLKLVGLLVRGDDAVAGG